MSSTTFQHVPLESPKEEIRLLRILPGTDEIQLTLQRHEFTADLDYVALSYEWGTTDRPENICLDGKILPLRQNLYAALQSLRTLQADRTEDRLFRREAPKFWIDAICINQIDDHEKNHQVAMMGRIYRQSAQTIAWLGQDGGNGSLAFRSMTGRRLSDSGRSAIENVLNRSYFQRMWIVQEVVLSKNLHFICGLARCPWDTLAQFWDRSEEHMQWYSDHFYWYHDVQHLSKELVDAKFNYDHSCQVTLLAYIHIASGNRHCMDFRDTVHAFLGLLKENNRAKDFEVDYQVSLEGLMIRLEAYSNPHPKEICVQNYDEEVLSIFAKYLTNESKRRALWYWRIMEVLHCLSVNVVGPFRNLTAVESATDLEVLLQLICWIVAGCGVDLFSILAVEAARPQVTQQSIAETTIETTWNRKVGQCSYQLGISKRPGLFPKSFARSAEKYQMASEAMECRELLLTFNKNVQDMIEASEYLLEIKEQEPSTAGSGIGTYIPASIERTIFANLLAHFFLHCFWRYEGSMRDENIGTFVDDKPGDADHFPKNLSQRYRMTIVETQDGEADQLLHAALATLPFEMTKLDGEWQNGSSMKPLTACLFRNGEWHIDSSTEGSEENNTESDAEKSSGPYFSDSDSNVH
ncbi:hypothetical protein E8E13_004809 [Curvularia kusanoi]|uniref:Heterokaryon incompatibility domain-containing protein n=1 Tax=Curvularia kusanoi TaxID=90978 RepID=A0A9P4T770_CURKU|nr:hypothetical protein E8E13_004809 [Curvularia kusanoi]